MRIWTLIVIACALIGCTAGSGVVMQNPRTNEVATCSGGRSNLDPWSQTDACVGGYEALGWVRSPDRAP